VAQGASVDRSSSGQSVRVSIADRNFRQSEGLVYSRAFTETHFWPGCWLISLAATQSRPRNGEQKNAPLHLTAHFRFVRRTINFNPDQVSSIAHTLTSTNPSGSAMDRTTSSVTSVGTPADFFGQETQTIPVSATFSRKIDNLFSYSPRLLVKI
jgi:hypothetical protein